VHVIWHEHIGVDCTLVPIGRLAHASQVQTTIRVVEETQAAVVSPLDDMQRNAR
jgi:hypothetical protein